MPQRNRVTPYGDIVASPLRGRWMGNRGSVHEGTQIVRPWNGKRWITCALHYKGWVAPKWEPRRWTALFFYDEPVALAAGHRPCALCRHADYQRFRAAFGARSADDMDGILHRDRVDGRTKRLHRVQWSHLPAGAFVDLAGTAALVSDDALTPWSEVDGYGEPVARPTRGDAIVITPACTIAVLQRGYEAALT